MELATGKIIRYAVIAGIAALVGWLMVEPMNRAQERAKIDAMRAIMRDLPNQIEDLARGQDGNPGNIIGSLRKAGEMADRIKKQQTEQMEKAAGNRYINTAYVIMIVGLMLGLGLALAEEITSFSLKRIGVRAVVGACVGAIGGLLAGVIGQFIFDAMQAVGFGVFLPMMIVARATAWACAGTAVGASVGAAGGSKRLAIQGMIGGFIGGGVGGMFFDLLSGIGQVNVLGTTTGYHYATAGRLFAGTLMGACIGAAIAMIQEYAKQAWIRVLVGRNEGKDYILTKPITSIGRDELADIPLYGDKNVQKRHATVQENLGVYTLNAAAPVTVNNQSVTQTQLNNDDLICVGRFTLRFTTRSLAGFSSYPGSISTTYPQTSGYQPQAQTQVYTAGDNVVPRLRGVNGILNLSVFDISSCRVTIGRDPSNDIPLTQDTSVSRRHAEICYENGRYIIRDVGSTNGVYVNGVRVTESPITPSDAVQIGGTQFRLVFEPPANQ